MSERVRRIFSSQEEELDAIVLMNGQEPMLDSSFFYACSLDSGLFEECTAILKPDGSALLLTSALEETAAGKSSAEVAVFRTAGEKEELICSALKHCRKIGINSRSASYHAVESLKKICEDFVISDAGPALNRARMIKDSDEISSIRKACTIASEVANMIPEFLACGITEYEAAAEINYNMQKKGASSTSFDTIAAFGKSAAEPHHTPENHSLVEEEMGLFDFGCRVSRYCSDITRTFSPHVKLKKFEDVYNTVLEAQKRGIEAIAPGVISSDVDSAARRYIDSTEYRGRMIHSLGHGVGLDVHDGGSFSPKSSIPLEEGMVMTVEPGIYIPGWGGIRIEDDVLVTKNGCEVLTHAKKDFSSISMF